MQARQAELEAPLARDLAQRGPIAQNVNYQQHEEEGQRRQAADQQRRDEQDAIEQQKVEGRRQETVRERAEL